MKNQIYSIYVDESFWENKFNHERDGILFVGNDSNREFKKVVELANYFKILILQLSQSKYQWLTLLEKM